CVDSAAQERSLAPGEQLVVGTATLYREKKACGAPLSRGPFTVAAAVPFMAPAPVMCPVKPIIVHGGPAATPAPSEPAGAPAASRRPRCQPIACAMPMCRPGQVARDADGCPSCSCR